MIGTKFRVFKDLTIEIPGNFNEEEFDEFLIQVHLKGLYEDKNTEIKQKEKVNVA